MSAQDRLNQLNDIILSNEQIITADASYNIPLYFDDTTSRVMREETELILNKQRTIFHILTVTTLVTLIITFSI
jgi:hypothetical protein